MYSFLLVPFLWRKATLRLSMVPLLFTVMLLAGLQKAQAQNTAYSDAGLPAPTVTADKEDYLPGETAVISGRGWTQDQIVDVHFEESPAYHLEHQHDFHNIAVDAGGNWTVKYPIEERHRGVAFTVHVVGEQTGYEALTWFTDGTITIPSAAYPVRPSNTYFWSELRDVENSSISPSNDAIIIKGGATLIIDRDDATFSNITLGSTAIIPNSPPGNGTLLFNAGSRLTATENVTLGDGTTTGTVNMTSGGTLRIAGDFTAPNGFLIEGLGTVEYNNSSERTILQVNYHHLTLSNSGKILLTKDVNKPITVNGNFTLNKTGEIFHVTDGNGNGTMTILGSFTMSQGEMRMATSNGSGLINLKGNFSHTGGTISRTTTNGNGTINFNGTSIQNYTSGGGFSGAVNFNVEAGSTLYLGTNLLGSNNSGLNQSTGAFTLSSGATLGIGHAGGIATTGNGGNIRVTGTRTYNAGANYIYNGSAAQVTGNGLPTAITGNLMINNPAGVTLTASTAVNGIFALTNGVLTTTNAFVLTANNIMTGGSSSSYVDGRLARRFSSTGSKDFAIGKGGNYRPVTINFTALSGTSTVISEQIESGFSGTFPSGSTQLGTRFWRVTESGSTSRTYNITLNGTGFTPTGDVKILKYNAPSTNTFFATTGTAPNYTASGINSFSDFALGEESCNTAVPTGDNTQSFCNAATVADLDATGTGTIKWYSASSGGTALASGASLSNNTTYYASQTVNGCESANRFAVAVTIYQLPTTATVGNPQNICGTLTSNALGGNTPAVGTGTWSKVSGPGTVTFSNSASGSSTATVSAYGSYVLRWTISNGTCTPSAADVTITFRPQATVTNHLVNNISNTKEVYLVYGCTTPQLKVTAIGSGVLTFKWFVNNTNSNVGGTQIPLALTSTYTVPAATGVGTHYYYAEVSLNGTCPVKSDVLKVVITQQEADADNEGNAYYTGPSFVWTPTTNSNTATVTLSAFLRNKSNEDCGDIATARVTFQIKSSSGVWTNIPSATNLPVSYVDANNPAKGGTAAAIVQLSIPTSSSSEIYDIKVIIGGNYKNSAINSQNGLNVTSISQVIVGKLVPGGAIGGGAKLINLNSSGYVKGSLFHKAEACFGVEYTLKGKSVSSPKGKITLRVYSYYDKTGKHTPGVLHTYVMKSNAIANLAITSPTATFTSKANVAEEIEGVLYPIEGNCTMIVDLGDYSNTGLSNILDKVGVTVHRNAGGLWYSNNWVNTKTVMANIFGGDVVITGTTSAATHTYTVNQSKKSELAEQNNVSQLTVRAFPNPAITHFNLKLESNNRTDAITLRVYNQLGQILDVKRNLFSGQIIQVGTGFKQGTYFVEVVQGTQKQNLQLVKSN